MKKNRNKKMSWSSGAPEDDVISLFAGLLTNPDVPLSLCRSSSTCTEDLTRACRDTKCLSVNKHTDQSINIVS
jgi:hypothetical protein